MPQCAAATPACVSTSAVPKRPAPSRPEELPEALLEQLDAVVGDGPEAEEEAVAMLRTALAKRRR
jgi:hypothetical protein